MAHAQIIEGTVEEITTVLAHGAYSGRKLWVIVDPDEDESDTIPTPSNTIRDQAHLEELLLAGLASPKHEVTDETWKYIRQQVRERHGARNPQA